MVINGYLPDRTINLLSMEFRANHEPESRAIFVIDCSISILEPLATASSRGDKTIPYLSLGRGTVIMKVISVGSHKILLFFQ